MLTKEKIIESLVIKVEAYGKTNFELLKLRAVEKTADVSSKLLSRTLLLIAFSFFVLFINIGISIWIGELLGKIYFGFGVVAIFYGLVSVVLLFTHRAFIQRMKNRIISQLLN